MVLESGKIGKGVPILFYANKIDLKGGSSVKEVEEILNLK